MRRNTQFEGEPDEDDRLDSGAYKSLTGGGSREGRALGRDVQPITDVGFTAIATANRMPWVKRPDLAVTRRNVVVAFPTERRRTRDRDTRIKARMLSPEGLALMLAFMLEGAALVSQHGLPPLTAQQQRRAENPVAGEEGDDDRCPENKHRDTRRDARRELLKERVRKIVHEHAVEDPDGKLWLHDEAPGQLVPALDAALEAAGWHTGQKNRSEAVRIAGFETDRPLLPWSGGARRAPCLPGWRARTE